MRPFYLTKNAYGFYSVRFVNSKTGKPMSAKSTHTKDLFEAMRIANEWYTNGIPTENPNSRLFEATKSNAENYSGLDLKSFVTRLSDSEIPKLLQLLIELRGVDFANLNVQIASQLQISVPLSKPQFTQKKEFPVASTTQKLPITKINTKPNADNLAL